MIWNVKKDILMRISNQPPDPGPNVFVIQDIPGTKLGTPKINIIGATQFGNLKVCLPENSQIILSPTYVITTLRSKLKDYNLKDYLLLTGDPAIIGVACSIVSDITNGEFNLFEDLTIISPILSPL